MLIHYKMPSEALFDRFRRHFYQIQKYSVIPAKAGI
uniref:Uncharacterized protein n=3 Tax=Neisseria meningitidis TaxID=487 RepID=C6SL87_NEIME|nr:hypothetical protein predicted by Glimmer/Critica [Neisseria meningitidis alpha153]CBA08894.1 hypothetical protein predicted by Glimmer/Critica [Neisseria meningitidis alpha275]CCA43768.1 hypothetical protein NMALPHA522_0227 [Neisseria meningitidis alpha522]